MKVFLLYLPHILHLAGVTSVNDLVYIFLHLLFIVSLSITFPPLYLWIPFSLSKLYHILCRLVAKLCPVLLQPHRL